MKISYDPEADALYVRFIEGPEECEVHRINDRVSVNLGSGDRVVGIEVLDASLTLELNDRAVTLENLTLTT